MSEWGYIRQHPEKGAEVLSHLAAYQNVADIVRYHHERLDGSGYPLGLTAESIPEASKMLAVADTYHAMTSDRPYRRALSSFEALKELRAMAGNGARRALGRGAWPASCETRTSPIGTAAPPTSWTSTSAAASTCVYAARRWPTSAGSGERRKTQRQADAARER